jgi:uncharacterized protein YndB with AHSA1/START domain
MGLHACKPFTSNIEYKMTRKVERTVSINTSPSKVWDYLTIPGLMRKWMGEPEMNIEVTTNWIVGSPILIKGFHHVNFENRGTVLQFAAQKVIQYSHLSSMSRLPDKEENYSIITFDLSPADAQTLLKIQIENFPTDSIYKHLDFYWQGTASILKNVLE